MSNGEADENGEPKHGSKWCFHKFLPFKPCNVAFELGAHVGLTTGMFAEYCKRVVALENSPAVLRTNMENNAKHSNILHSEFHSVMDDWKTLPKLDSFYDRKKADENEPKAIDFMLIDAAHDEGSVLSDLRNAKKHGFKHLILDDYGAEAGVKKAVKRFVEVEKQAKIEKFIGEGPTWSFDGGKRVINDWEGVILKVIDAEEEENASNSESPEKKLSNKPVENTEWILYPPGVFSSGNFQQLGSLHLSENSRGNLTFVHDQRMREIEYRPYFERPDMPLNFVIVENDEDQNTGVRRRYYSKLVETFQGGLLFEDNDSDQPYVLVAKHIVRTIGEKLLSTLY